jgi:hypothetical protein
MANHARRFQRLAVIGVLRHFVLVECQYIPRRHRARCGVVLAFILSLAVIAGSLTGASVEDEVDEDEVD